MRTWIRATVMAITLTLLLGSSAHAQWVFLARKVLGRVESLAAPAQGKGEQEATGGYEFGSVILEAPADKVYQTAIKMLAENPDVTVTRKDDGDRSIEFTRGDLAISMKISSLGEKLAQIMVASPPSPKKPGGTSTAVERILAVCKSMGVECSPAPE